MTQERWTEVVTQIFNEVRGSKDTIDAETAVNAFRLIITLGADMDECFLDEVKTRGTDQLSLDGFSSVCNTVVNKWPPLAE